MCWMVTMATSRVTHTAAWQRPHYFQSICPNGPRWSLAAPTLFQNVTAHDHPSLLQFLNVITIARQACPMGFGWLGHSSSRLAKLEKVCEWENVWEDVNVAGRWVHLALGMNGEVVNGVSVSWFVCL